MMIRALAGTVLLLIIAIPPGRASHPPEDPAFLQLFQALEPRDKLEVHGILAAWDSLQHVADATGSGAATARLQDGQRRLQELLPQATVEASGTSSVLRTCADTLAAELAAATRAAPGGVPAGSRLAHVFTLVNIAWFCGCLLVVAAGISLFGAYMAALVILVPLVAWEAAGYGASLWLLSRAVRSGPGAAPYVALTALLMLTALVSGTAGLHFRPLVERYLHGKLAPACAFGACTLLYGAVAVRLQATLLGTITVWWAMSALGFTILVFPFVTVIGFRSGIACPFAASLLLILGFMPFKAGWLPTPTAMRPFEAGVWLWCTLVLNVANLILAHKRWGPGPAQLPRDVWVQIPLYLKVKLTVKSFVYHMLTQIPAVAVIGGTLACGLLLDVEQARAIGSAFGFIWFLSKLTEFDWQRVGFAWGALFLGSLLWGCAYAVHTWPQLFRLHLVM